jgi:hypothetical protein
MDGERVRLYVVLAFLSIIAGCTSAVIHMATAKGAVQRSDSGLEGTAHSKVMSGMPGGPTTGGPGSIEFAVAPIENTVPSYQKAVFVKSDKAGQYKISLPPGKYWIGPRAKALNPVNYDPGPFSFSEKTVVVEQGTFTHVDVFEIGYAP